jgi:nucleotide-binding universal stress UspA family protein
VVGVDGSANSMEALVWSAHEARLRGAVLEVIHVRPLRHEVLELFATDVLNSETAVLDSAVSRAETLESEITVIGRLCDPPAAEVLIDASEGAELLVVGKRGIGGFKGLASGSVASECVRRGRCPVVIVQLEGQEVSSVGTFGSPDSTEASRVPQD